MLTPRRRPGPRGAKAAPYGRSTASGRNGWLLAVLARWLGRLHRRLALLPRPEATTRTASGLTARSLGASPTSSCDVAVDAGGVPDCEGPSAVEVVLEPIVVSPPAFFPSASSEEERAWGQFVDTSATERERSRRRLRSVHHLKCLDVS